MIFPVKLQAYYKALKETGVLFEPIPESRAPALVHNDEKVRIALRSPEVVDAACRLLKVDNCRVRMAFLPTPTFVGLVDTELECYSYTGDSLLHTPMQVIQLDADLANAVELELLNRLLAKKGITIPLL